MLLNYVCFSDDLLRRGCTVDGYQYGVSEGDDLLHDLYCLLGESYLGS